MPPGPVTVVVTDAEKRHRLAELNRQAALMEGHGAIPPITAYVEA